MLNTDQISEIQPDKTLHMGLRTVISKYIISVSYKIWINMNCEKSANPTFVAFLDGQKLIHVILYLLY